MDNVAPIGAPPALISALRKAKKILCVSHVSPDGDAVGSLLGMGWILRHLNKTPVLTLPDPASEEFSFLPGISEIVGPEKVEDDYDLIVCLDASSPDRMGAVYRPDQHGTIPLMVIDHHVTNTFFGDFNWVEPGCAATCQMLVYLADALAVPLQGEVAVSLLTGLVTDTLCFRTSNTDARVLQAAMRLVDGGGNLAQIAEQTLRRRPYSVLKLWGLVLPQMQLEEGVIWTTVSQAQLAAAGIVNKETGGLANQLITAKEADISATFIEVTNEVGQPAVECSFRAKPGFDVSEVAFALGGGGHPPAAGCTVAGSLDEVPVLVVEKLQMARAGHLEELAEDSSEEAPRTAGLFHG